MRPNLDYVETHSDDDIALAVVIMPTFFPTVAYCRQLRIQWRYLSTDKQTPMPYCMQIVAARIDTISGSYRQNVP